MLTVDEERCTGCRACETACSFIHTGYFNRGSRIRINKNEAEGKDEPLVCRQCPDTPCIKACPVDALTIDKKTGAVKVMQEKCIGCKACESVCPYQAIFFDKLDIPLICDLCGGKPDCVERCPVNAIQIKKTGVN